MCVHARIVELHGSVVFTAVRVSALETGVVYYEDIIGLIRIQFYVMACI